jgi:hypothetical protein
MVSSNIRFSDIQNQCVKIFIDGLVERAVVSGFADRTFRPYINLTSMLYFKFEILDWE